MNRILQGDGWIAHSGEDWQGLKLLAAMSALERHVPSRISLQHGMDDGARRPGEKGIIMPVDEWNWAGM